MNRANLIDELSYKEGNKTADNNKQDTNIDNNYIIQLTDNIIQDFVSRRPTYINDAVDGKLSPDSIENEVIAYLDRKNIDIEIPSRAKLIKGVHDYLFGYYFLQPLIDDDDISDVRVLKYDNVQIKVLGTWEKSDVKFPNADSYETFYNYLVIKLGGVSDKRNALQILSDRSQEKSLLRISLSSSFVNSVPNSYISIRKIPKEKYTMELLRDKYKMIDSKVYDYSCSAAKAGLSVLLCGKGGSGKTTFINAMLEKIPFDRATLVIQESEELHSDHPNMMFKKTVAKTGENDAEYTLRDESTFSMTESIDQLVIGEIKGPEAMDLFKIINTGHIGWASVHANNSKDAPDKLVDYMEEAGTNQSRAALLRMLKAIDVIVFMKDFKVMEVTEVEGFDEEKQTLKYNPIFKYNYRAGEYERLNDSCEKIKKKVDYQRFKDSKDDKEVI